MIYISCLYRIHLLINVYLYRTLRIYIHHTLIYRIYIYRLYVYSPTSYYYIQDSNAEILASKIAETLRAQRESKATQKAAMEARRAEAVQICRDINMVSDVHLIHLYTVDYSNMPLCILHIFTILRILLFTI